MKSEVFTPANLPPATRDKKRYGVLGFPVSHSLSPPMQEAGFGALGIPAEYFRIEIPAHGLSAALPNLRQAGLRGWNCTLPHKEAMFSLCAEKDASAQESASVNTVVVTTNGFRGFSTDADGWEDAVREAWNLPFSARKVLVLGCGGVGRTLACRLARKGCRALALVNRNPEKARLLAEHLRPLGDTPVSTVPWNSPELEKAVADADLLIQATPLGLSPEDPLPVAENSLHPNLRVYDTVYRKDFTPLIHAARARGCPALDGLGMLLHQGARSLEIWTGKKPPLAIMRSALEKAAGRSV
ncbi:MAG: shikimate dehydrogenase [Verrucomicrobia bacterium]|nr:shikimate dehydrogenase [Verrucomicrobiota bacterium]